MTAPIYPFTTLRYSLNPSIWQPGQAVTIKPTPDSPGISYAITSGSLPPGLTIDSLTGVISGTAGPVIPKTTVVVGATQSDSSVHYCTVILTIEDIPITAPLVNQASSTSLTNLQATAAQNFINNANQIISNNDQIGLFQAWFDMLPHLPVASLRRYFESLGYTFWLTQGSYNGYSISLEPFTLPGFGPFYGGYPFNLINYNTDYAFWYGSPQNFGPPPRILIKWNSTPVYPTWPYYPFP